MYFIYHELSVMTCISGNVIVLCPSLEGGWGVGLEWLPPPPQLSSFRSMRRKLMGRLTAFRCNVPIGLRQNEVEGAPLSSIASFLDQVMVIACSFSDVISILGKGFPLLA